MRDYRALDTIRIPFGTNGADGAALAPTGTPTAALYEDGSLVEITAGLTVTPSWDGKTGANMLVIDGATAGLKPGSTYHAQIAATISGLSCLMWIGQFSVMAQGGDVVSRGQLVAGGAGSFQLAAGQRDRVKIGDAIRIVGGTGYGYRPILTYNSSTGIGSVSAWDVNPVANDYYEVVSLPNPEPLASTDFADLFLTAPKIQDNAFTESKFATDALSARVLKADAVTEMQAGLATAAAQTSMQTDVTTIKNAVDTEVAAILAIAQKLDGALELNGGLYRFTVAALANAPTGGSAPTAVQVRDAIFAQLIETGLTFEDMLKLSAAVLFGKTDQLQGLTTTFSSADLAAGLVVGTKTRITATREADSDRAALAVDLT